MHSLTLYPMAAPIQAYAIPVFPLVASRMVFSGVRAPLFSPSRIIHSAGRSLTEPPGLYHSALPRILTPGTSAEMLGNSSSGVFPTSSVMFVPVGSLIRVIMSGLLYKAGLLRPANPERRYLTNVIAGRLPLRPSGYGWCAANDYTRVARLSATVKSPIMLKIREFRGAFCDGR